MPIYVHAVPAALHVTVRVTELGALTKPGPPLY